LIIDDYWIPIQLYWNPMYGACMRNNHPSIWQTSGIRPLRCTANPIVLNYT
jgi:hypothetical protein